MYIYTYKIILHITIHITSYFYFIYIYMYVGRFLKPQKRNGPVKQIQDMLMIVLIFEHLEGLYVIGK